MDPTETLENIRRHIKKYLAGNTLTINNSDLQNLIKTINNLDKWLVRGGHFPTQWIEPRNTFSNKDWRSS